MSSLNHSMRLPALAAAMYIYICVLSLDSCCSSTDARTFEDFNVDILRVRARAHRHTPLGGNDLSDTWLSTQLQVGLTYAQLTGLLHMRVRNHRGRIRDASMSAACYSYAMVGGCACAETAVHGYFFYKKVLIFYIL